MASDSGTRRRSVNPEMHAPDDRRCATRDFSSTAHNTLSTRGAGRTRDARATMAERAPLLPEVTSDVASVPALRHVEADEDGQRDASRARTRGRVRAAFAATGLMALVGAAATRASRPDAGGFFAPRASPARASARGGSPATQMPTRLPAPRA